MGQERIRQKDDLLFGFARIHRMDREQIRRQFAGFCFACFADGDAWVDPGELVVEPGRDLHHFPAIGAAETRVGGQQALQQSGPTAHHPDDDDRRGDPLVEDLRVAADPFLSAQPHSQAVHDARPQDVRPDRVEISIGVVGQQHAQRAFELPGAPIGERLLALRVSQHGCQVEDTRISHAIRTSNAG